ncbi:MAG: hypothetical protein KBF76_13800, partial [Verrucomicrobiales bacterium]|nr:hypothetical protein [Verrucomicrobiales bacterium]
SNTAAIAVEKKTGPLQSMDVLSLKGDTAATSPSKPPAKELDALQAKLKKETERATKLDALVEARNAKLSSLEKELSTIQSELKVRDKSLKALESATTEKTELTDSLKSLQSELAKTKQSINERDEELGRLRKEAVQALSEREKLRVLLTDTEGREQETRGKYSITSEELAKAKAETADLSKSVAAEKADLAAELKIARSEAEKERKQRALDLKEKEKETSSLQSQVDLLTAAGEKDKSGLSSQLQSIRKLAEKQQSELESQIAGKIETVERQNHEISSLNARIAALDESAKTETSGLATELATTLALVSSSKEESAKLQAEFAAERRAHSKEISALESGRGDLSKTLETLREKFSNQTDELGALKMALSEKEKELGSSRNELKKSEKVAKELESLQENLEKTKAELKAALREKEAVAASKKTEKRLVDLEKSRLVTESETAQLKENLAERSASEKSVQDEAKQLKKALETLRLESIATEAKGAETRNAEIALLQSKHTEQEKELSRLQKDLVDAQQQVATSGTERAALASALEELKNLGGSAVVEATEAKSQLQKIESECNELRKQIKKQVPDLQAAKAEANDLRVELRKSKEQAEQAFRDSEKTLRSRIAELETALGSEKVRASDTLTQKETLSSEVAGLRKEIEALLEEGAQLRARNEEVSKNNGRLQAELNRESAEKAQGSEALEISRERASQLAREVVELKESLSGKNRELAEREQLYTRNESETVQRLKRDLTDATSAREAAEEKAAKANKEKHSLSSAFERLKETYDQAELALKQAKEQEEGHNHSKGLLARRLEKAEAGNHELAARIKEESLALFSSRSRIESLETQLRENESEAVNREREKISALQVDISQRQRKAAEEERQRNELAAELAKTKEAKRDAEDRILALGERITEMESETASTRALLTETERKRGDFENRFMESAALAETHANSLEALGIELSETIRRFKSSESNLLGKHADEVDGLLAELRSERSHKEGLEVELANTRVGMSEALHRAREESSAAQAKLIADRNAKLAAGEDELSEVIRSREEVEEIRNRLEDELNQREEEIEKLSEKIEDLDLQLIDEIKSRHIVQKELETTKEGFSRSLHSNWGHLATARTSLKDEKQLRENLAQSVSDSEKEIERITALLGEKEQQLQDENRDWENRYEKLRDEKLTLASEDADLKMIRDQIVEATTKRRQIENELNDLSAGMKEFQMRHRELQLQKDTLLSDREELKAGLNVARSELDLVQRRCQDSHDHETKLSETILAAERRIQSLRKLESEMEHAVERKRQQNILSRGEVFSEELATLAMNGEFSHEDFYRKLVTKLDLIDDLTKRYDNKWRYPKVSEQLSLLKRSFVDFLHDHSVKQFDLEPGTVLSVAERKRIKLVPLQNGATKKNQTNGNGTGAQNALVVETLRPGYVYQNGSTNVIIRKAEVVVS